MKRRMALVLSLLFLGWIASAQNLSITYLEGNAFLLGGVSWVELKTGDSVPSGARLKLGGDSYVELQSVGARIILSRPGSYSIRDLLASNRALLSAGAGKSLSVSLARLFTVSASKQNTISGARAANESEGEDQGWVENNARVFLDAGRSFMASGQYEKAAEQFSEAMAATTEVESSEAAFCLASAYSLMGRTREAVKATAVLRVNGTEDWVPDFVLLKAKLLIDTSAFDLAEQWLNGNGRDLSKDARRAPVYYFLSGLASRGIGDTRNEEQSFSRVISLAPSSDIAKTAAQLLESQ